MISDGLRYVVPYFLQDMIKCLISLIWFYYQVHMEADRKALPGDANIAPVPHFLEKITYKVGSKVIFLVNEIFYSLELAKVTYKMMVNVMCAHGGCFHTR